MLKRIAARDLRVGMFVVEYGDGSFSSPHVRLERILESPDELESLRRETRDAVVDVP
jgi:hypothetical protein